MNELAEKIKENCDIVDVIGRYVNLKRVGSNFKGLCPFHNEKTPSFTVSQEKQFYMCFGCGKKGDVINFVQETENLDFLEAVEKLAEQQGIEIDINQGRADGKKEEMYEVTRQAAIHFYKNLRHGANDGLRYVISRGISPEIAKKFGIGYAKDGWEDLVEYFRKNNLSEELGYESGLFSKNKKNGNYDKFRNRVIFPIRNTRDKVIGFGGRAIDGTLPKYLNSPETIIFKKKENLYGLDLAKNSIRKRNFAIMVEGYMDVVSLAAVGVENVVATLGTALTPEQAKLLKRYTDTVVLAYDSDDAGQAATRRGIDLLLDADLKVKVLRLSEGKDPDEYIKKNGKSAFEELIENAIPWMEYKINCIKNKYDMNTTDGSIRFLEEVSVELQKVKSPLQQAAYVKLTSEMSGIPESSIRREIEAGFGSGNIAGDNFIKPVNREKKEVYVKAKTQGYKIPVVKQLIRLMIDSGKFIPIIAENDEITDYFYGSGYEKILEQIMMNYTDDSEIDREVIEDNLEEEDLSRFKDIEHNIMPVIEEEKTLLDCAKRIKLQSLEIRRREAMKIMEILDEETDRSEMNKLTSEIIDIGNKINALREGKE